MKEMVLTRDLLLALPPTAPAAEWAALLHQEGLLSLAPPSAVPALAGGWSPAQGLRELQGTLEAALAAEAQAPQGGTPELPGAIWVLLGMSLLGLILFAPAAVALLGPLATWGGIAFAAAVALLSLWDRRRHAALQPLLEARARLHASLEALLERTFVGTVGGVLLICVPELEQARGMLEALALSDPEAPVRIDLEAAIHAAEQRLAALRALPEEPWTDAGLRLDLRRWADAIDQMG